MGLSRTARRIFSSAGPALPVVHLGIAARWHGGAGHGRDCGRGDGKSFGRAELAGIGNGGGFLRAALEISASAGALSESLRDFRRCSGARCWRRSRCLRASGVRCWRSGLSDRLGDAGNPAGRVSAGGSDQTAGRKCGDCGRGGGFGGDAVREIRHGDSVYLVGHDRQR